ncbi:hypothetical protein D3C72_2365950 [compost metagenome]
MECSFAFYVPRAVKASGITKMYWSKAENNPGTQENSINYRHYFIAMPTENVRIGALVSDKAA